MRFAFLPLALLVACAAPLEPGPSGYAVKGGALRAPTGEAIFLRSINAHEESKWVDDHLVPLGDEDLAEIHAGGFNSVRLLTFWGAVMPEPDAIDREYLGRLRAEAQKLSDDDLYVVIDMHQDLWGAPFGNGAPLWACPEGLREGYESDSPWWVNYFSPQVCACFDRLWFDDEVKAQLQAAWVEVAIAVCDVDGIVGFDLLNEPWPGTNVGEPAFDQVLLYEGYYRPTMDLIEAACPGKAFFLEPSRAYDFGLADPLILDDEDRDRALLAPHFYPMDVHEPGREWTTSRADLASMIDHLYGPWLDDGVPLWLGEYGGITTNPGFDVYLDDLHGLLLERRVGHALWAFNSGSSYGFLDEEGAPRSAFASTAALPVPTLLPDWPVDMRADEGGLEIEGACVQGRSLEVRGGALDIVAGPLSPAGKCVADGPFHVRVR
jgi:endoglycosylceramidase